MRAKRGVKISDLNIVMRPCLMVGEAMWKLHGIKAGMTITSTGDSIHSAGSIHPYGYAFDSRIRDLGRPVEAKARRIAIQLDKIMGDGYDIIFEHNHIHWEYNQILGEIGQDRQYVNHLISQVTL